MDFKRFGQLVMLVGVIVLSYGLFQYVSNQPVSQVKVEGQDFIKKLFRFTDIMGENMNREFRRSDSKKIMLWGVGVMVVGAIFTLSAKSSGTVVPNNSQALQSGISVLKRFNLAGIGGALVCVSYILPWFKYRGRDVSGLTYFSNLAVYYSDFLFGRVKESNTTFLDYIWVTMFVVASWLVPMIAGYIVYLSFKGVRISKKVYLALAGTLMIMLFNISYTMASLMPLYLFGIETGEGPQLPIRHLHIGFLVFMVSLFLIAYSIFTSIKNKDVRTAA